MTDTATRTRVIHVDDMPNYPDAVYIGRAVPRRGMKKSFWANEHKVGRDGSRAEVIGLYEDEMRTYAFHVEGPWRDAIAELVGKPLACWCRHDGEERTPENACHGDVLIELIEELGLEPQT